MDKILPKFAQHFMYFVFTVHRAHWHARVIEAAILPLLPLNSVLANQIVILVNQTNQKSNLWSILSFIDLALMVSC